MGISQTRKTTCIRDIFTRYAAGDGAYTIAAALNAIKAPSPRAQLRRVSAWSVSSIREVLKRPLYRGEIVWGKTTSAYGRELGKLTKMRGGIEREKAQIPTKEETWIRLPVDESLRIVDASLAARVDARRGDRRTRYLASLGANQGRNGKMPEKAHGKYLLTGGMLICPTCHGHFEGLRYPKEVYVCSTRRRKPGACTNTLAFPMALADHNVLEMLEGELLGTKFINELLSMVHQGESENLARVAADRNRLQGEIEKLVGSIAMGQAPASIVSAIRERELEVARLEARLRAPRKEAPNLEKLREALEQRAEDWKRTLREEPKVARLLIRRMIGPLELYDASKPEWQMPDFIKADCVVKTGLIDGLAEIHDVASPAAFAGDVRAILSFLRDR